MTEPLFQTAGEFDRHYAAEQLRRSRHPLRRFVKGFYLRNILRDARGATIDFGCGAGQLLKQLPEGSMGLEINPYLIAELRKTGLTVFQARGQIDDLELADFPVGSFKSLTIAHVLEHFPDPAAAIRLLLRACHRIGIERVVIVVPGAKGFASDHTHKTFIDRAYIEEHLKQSSEGFVRSRPSYFPGPWEWIGRYFVFHEMKVVFEHSSDAS